jgi:DNA polymerase I-like protein with 3'-5' exonuclease and polymerase domains
MNVQTREQFDAFLHDLNTEALVAVDTETNGLKPYGTWDNEPNQMISMSFYFPRVKRSYNLPFRHGKGRVELSWGKKEPRPFEELTWQGKIKGQLYIAWVYEQFMKTVNPAYFENLPLAWLEEIRTAWGREGQTMIFHNWRFDGHVLYNEGFRTPWKIVDTMILLHLVNEDWRGIELAAPFKWTTKDAKMGLCGDADVGHWAYDKDGNVMRKSQQGNRQLKWQAALHNFPGATDGEESLYAAIKEFEMVLVGIACQPENQDHPYNSFAVQKKGFNRGKVEEKLSLDTKAQMWMLPSSAVAAYAELDTFLTYELYEWTMKVIKNWHNEELAETLNAVQLKVAWQMEVNGFKLDREQALREVEKLTPRIAEVEQILNKVALGWGFVSKEQAAEGKFKRKEAASAKLQQLSYLEDEQFKKDVEEKLGTPWEELYKASYGLDLSEEEDEDEAFNPSSNPKLKKFLNSGVLGVDFGKALFPEWFPEELTRELDTYAGVYVKKTDKEALEPLEKHPIIKLIKVLRTMKKSRDTYLNRWLRACDKNGIVRFSMNADGTVSGRFSSSGDAGNGQNIPDRNGYTIKMAIVPYNDSWVFVAIDYGQLELRVACDYAERRLKFDPNFTMTKLFQSGADMHAWVRDDVGVRDVLFPGLSDEQVLIKIGLSMKHKDVVKYGAQAMIDGYCRQVAKTMNFGLLYSGTEYMLSKLLKIQLAPAKVLVDRWKARFPAFQRAQDHYTNEALTRRDLPDPTAGIGQYSQQFISKRFRKLHKYPTWKWYENEYGNREGFNPQQAAAKKVWNNVVQGEGGYLCTVSALRFVEKYGNENVKLFANIHDALDGFVRRGHEDEVKRLAEIMVDWDIIPDLTVDVQRSYDGTWQGIKAIKKDWAFSKGADWNDPAFDTEWQKWVRGE